MYARQAAKQEIQSKNGLSINVLNAKEKRKRIMHDSRHDSVGQTTP